jgi:hypothetical protein
VCCYAQPFAAAAAAAHAVLLQEEWLAQVEGLWEDLIGEEGLPQIARGDRNPDTRSMHGAAQVCCARCAFAERCVCALVW